MLGLAREREKWGEAGCCTRMFRTSGRGDEAMIS
jgi:hypothetical protein